MDIRSLPLQIRFMRYFANILTKILFAMTVFAGIALPAPAQESNLAIKGTPRIIHYTKKDFQSDPQFWCMTQDHDGLLYFGNNEGTLIFDGERWGKVRLPNNSSIRSLKVAMDGKIYAGGYNEFGTIERDEFGNYHYKSLVELLRPEDRGFENIWQIHEAQGAIIFRSIKMMIILSNGKMATLPSANYDFSAVVHNRLYFREGEYLKQLDVSSMELRKVAEMSVFKGEALLTLLPGFANDEVFAITKQGSFFRFNNSGEGAVLWQKFLAENSNNLYTSAIRGSDGNYYIGTLRSKVISIGREGERIEMKVAFDAVQDNTVLNLFESAEGNIWALLNNGIDCIDLSSPLTALYRDASVFDVKIFDEKMFVATNQGVLMSTTPSLANLSSTYFTAIDGLEGQVWSLQTFENRLLCSHDRGIFVIKGNTIEQVPGISGVWKIIPIRERPHQYLACTYDGIQLLEFNNGQFVVRYKITGFQESSRDILQGDEPGVFWICHGYKGVFRVRLDDEYERVLSLEHFKDDNGLPSPFNINVTRWKDAIVFTTNNGIFEYNNESGQFEPHSALNTIFGIERNVRQLREVGDKTWFIHDNEVGYFFTAENNPELQKGYFLQLKGAFNPSMECIVPLNEYTVLLGTNGGLYSFDLKFSAAAKLGTTRLSRVAYSVSGGQTIAASLDQSILHRLPHDVAAVEFAFAAPSFQDKLNVEYSYWLEGAEGQWSPWNTVSRKDYSLLPAGTYNFHVKARSQLGEIAEESVYRFEILSAWYSSRWAVFCYVIAGLGVLAFAAFVVDRRLRMENAKKLEEEKKKRRVLELELQRIRLLQEKDAIKKDKDQLEEDVIYKSKELANYTMLLVKKRDLLTHMHDELKELREVVKNESGRQLIRDLIKKINMNLQDEEHIKVFEANFERVHHEFFTQLKANFPDLTAKELQLCAFVRMNLTNKEIASILNISVRGVETARYRLRKRLGLTQEEDMGHFFEKHHAPGPQSWQSTLG